jgi:integrase
MTLQPGRRTAVELRRPPAFYAAWAARQVWARGTELATGLRRRREHAMTIPTPPGVGPLLAAADERFTTFIALSAIGGLRLGEAAALRPCR